MVTKGLSRKAVILAKYTVAAVLMTVSYWTSYAATYGCTALLWNDRTLSHIALAAFALWLSGFLYLSILMTGCVMFRQTFTSILFTGGMVALLSLAGMAEPIARFHPFILTSKKCGFDFRHSSSCGLYNTSFDFRHDLCFWFTDCHQTFQ